MRRGGELKEAQGSSTVRQECLEMKQGTEDHWNSEHFCLKSWDFGNQLIDFKEKTR